MSIINQMLRDLDARGAAATDLPVAPSLPPKKRRPDARMAVFLLLLLSAGGVAGYLTLSGASHERMQTAAVVSDRHAANSMPVAAPPIHSSPAAPASPAAKPAAPPGELKAPAIAAATMSQSQDGGQPLATPKPANASAVPASVQAEPAVVKKMTELSPEAEAQQHYDDALALRRSGKVDAAIGQFRQALERNPGMLNARIQLARLLQESGQADAALSLLKAGYDQQADDGLAIAAGRLLADQGRRDDALNWLARGRESLRPADHALMGALLAQAQRYEEAVKAYQRALAADPHQGGWLLGLGLALESLGRIEESQMVYRNALERGEFKPDVVRFLRQKSGLSGL